jgi:queuosine biosynthesis protein QueD
MAEGMKTASETGAAHRGIAHAVLFTDGGSRGNPGRSGIGFVIKADDGEGALTICRGGAYIGITTNNQAEYQALIWGLRNAERLGIGSLEILADSELVVNQLNGDYKVRNAGIRPFHQEAGALLSAFESHSIKHVRREGNAEADALANEAMDRQESVGDYVVAFTPVDIDNPLTVEEVRRRRAMLAPAAGSAAAAGSAGVAAGAAGSAGVPPAHLAAGVAVAGSAGVPPAHLAAGAAGSAGVPPAHLAADATAPSAAPALATAPSAADAPAPPASMAATDRPEALAASAMPAPQPLQFAMDLPEPAKAADVNPPDAQPLPVPERRADTRAAERPAIATQRPATPPTTYQGTDRRAPREAPREAPIDAPAEAPAVQKDQNKTLKRGLPMYILTVKDHFDAAHALVGYPGQCKNVHGHTWDVEVSVRGIDLDGVGIVYDFKDLKEDLQYILEAYDHKYLNDVAPFDTINATAENLARVIYEQLEAMLPARIEIVEVSVWESPVAKLTFTRQ